MSTETGLDAEGLDAYRREVSRLMAESKLLRAAADPAKVGAVGDLVKHATRLVQIERDDARAERDALKATIEQARARLQTMLERWKRAQVADQFPSMALADVLAALDAPEATTAVLKDSVTLDDRADRAEAVIERSRAALAAFDGRGQLGPETFNFDVPTPREVLDAWRASLDVSETSQQPTPGEPEPEGRPAPETPGDAETEDRP